MAYNNLSKATAVCWFLAGNTENTFHTHLIPEIDLSRDKLLIALRIYLHLRKGRADSAQHCPPFNSLCIS